jgi:hypothetical protein
MIFDENVGEFEASKWFSRYIRGESSLFKYFASPDSEKVFLIFPKHGDRIVDLEFRSARGDRFDQPVSEICQYFRLDALVESLIAEFLHQTFEPPPPFSLSFGGTTFAKWESGGDLTVAEDGTQWIFKPNLWLFKGYGLPATQYSLTLSVCKERYKDFVVSAIYSLDPLPQRHKMLRSVFLFQIPPQNRIDDSEINCFMIIKYLLYFGNKNYGCQPGNIEQGILLKEN